jgi:Branched-chain polyamine synthase A C-terminal domain
MEALERLYSDHRFFVDLRRDVEQSVRRRPHLTLDEVVVESRRPVRTALLMLQRLLHEGQIRALGGRLSGTSGNGGVHANVPEPRPPSGLAAHYMRLVSSREAPALLWSQRRLTPDSAVERAAYIVRRARNAAGSAIFLGDDDMVSPLVAAMLPGWTVHVVDIDRTVLEVAAGVARALDAEVLVYHSDLSAGEELGTGPADIVVSDPFPSGDGSFEALFWARASRLLRDGGYSVTTIAPSHKPVGFDAQALAKQQRLGLALLDVAADFGRYEVFDFEFTELEREWLAELAQRPSVSQTKSLMTAQKIGSPDEALLAEIAAFDFARWSEATVSHYLTQQAGAEDQIEIARTRGRARPEPARGSSKQATLSRPADVPAARVRTVLRDAGAGDAALDEAQRLMRDVPGSRAVAELQLCARAIESWTRHRLDE